MSATWVNVDNTSTGKLWSRKNTNMLTCVGNWFSTVKGAADPGPPNGRATVVLMTVDQAKAAVSVVSHVEHWIGLVVSTSLDFFTPSPFDDLRPKHGSVVYNLLSSHMRKDHFFLCCLKIKWIGANIYVRHDDLLCILQLELNLPYSA